MGSLESLAALLGGLIALGLMRRKGEPLKPSNPHPDNPYRNLFKSAGSEFGISWEILEAIARTESGLNPNAVSKPNRNGTVDLGLMQINEETAKTFKVDRPALMVPETNIRTAARLLVSIQKEWLTLLRRPPTKEELIAAYNAGGPAIRRRGIFNTSYVASVQKHLDRIEGGLV